METDTETSKLETDDKSKDEGESEKNWLNKSKESDGENVEAIRKFIEQQEIELEDQKNVKQSKKNETESVPEIEISKDSNETQNETVTVATCMLDMILTQSEDQIFRNNGDKSLSKQSLSPLEKGNNTVSLSVGSKVEAKDFAELWYPAHIVEVDYDDMEVLVHYENESKKHDEWINVSSPRLRPLNSSTASSPTPVQQELETEKPVQTEVTVKEETKTEEKPKLKFVVGERCLARWRDNRRFIATISKDLGDGKYEIFFDDGFQWKCTTSRLHKYKDSISVDTSQTPNSSTPSPVQPGTGPSSAVPFPGPAYHTHLFDPNRDYLGSKSERREMKRKLNIKEIFNIGQKRPKKEHSKDKPEKVVQKQRKPVKKKIETDTVEKPVKKEIPEAVASIIGTVKEEEVEEPKIEIKIELEPEATDLIQLSDLTEDTSERKDSTENVVPDEMKKEDFDVGSDTPAIVTVKSDEDSPACIPEEEIKLEKFDKEDDGKHEEVIGKIKEVITKIEDDLNKVDVLKSPKVEIKEESVKTEETKELPEPVETDSAKVKDKKEKLSKIKKGKKLRLLQEKKVKRQVEKVKCELEEMKKQVEEMRKQMMLKTEELEGQRQQETPLQMPESFLLPGEWCAKWVNGQPVGKVSEVEPDHKEGAKTGLPRRSVQVEDKRLPEGWTKHLVRRSFGHSAGKWNVVLVSPDNTRFHTKADMRNYFEKNTNEALVPYEHALMDFGLHLKLSRRMGWFSTTPGGAADTEVVPMPASILSSTSPLVKRRKLSLKKPKFPSAKSGHKSRPHPLKIKMKTKRRKMSTGMKITGRYKRPSVSVPVVSMGDMPPSEDPSQPSPTFDLPLEDGYVYVGSLKVQIIDNLLRCPAEGCLKNFRNNTLLQMHIKHYHRELCKKMGRTPKVLDLAYARTMPTDVEQPRGREPDLKTIKVKIPRPPKREVVKQEINQDLQVEIPTTPVKEFDIPQQDSPKLRIALSNKPVKRPRVLLPVRRVEPEIQPTIEELESFDLPEKDSISIPPLEVLDFETAISTHTVTKPIEKKKLTLKAPMSEDEEWCSVTSDVDTRSSFPRSGTPDSKSIDIKPVSSESNDDRRDSSMYMYTENGERIKIVHMKREEIINCHCGVREEDGLMVQCELCLCWQHALCHNIQKESEVPEKYTCSICLNPRRARRSQRFLHDQDRLYEGLLPGAKPCESLRRSHELSGNLLRIQDALHALRVKYYVATKKDHPKLYLWAKDWDNADISFSQEKLNSDYSDLNIIINSIGKENLPLKEEQLEGRMEEDHDRYTPRDGLGPQTVLSGLLSSPGGGPLDLPISTSELERLAKSVQEQDGQRVSAPQPEAAIENTACRERLLRHIQRCQALIDARLDSIEAQVAELESQDPSFEDDETADYFPRTKQTIQMLMRDLDNMEELGAS